MRQRDREGRPVGAGGSGGPGKGWWIGKRGRGRWIGKAGTGRRIGGIRRIEGIGRDRGAATIWAAGLMALVFAVTATVVFAGTARVARHRAQSAADLSALAAARLAFAAPERGCAEASSLAEGNGAMITRCFIDGDGIADVQVAVGLSLPVLGDRTIMANARAGPVNIAGLIG
ncbi:Rv3654c family TadE-like protein [Streptosporangium roseum]|uniref:Rv3654c family TadE-like protein n=1 Tax=Streptosporangium roseum TaxID=2001 RepID=UPI0022AFE803|nr:Rv3654c family TadE-like protein [Streptosporangium roseum]